MNEKLTSKDYQEMLDSVEFSMSQGSISLDEIMWVGMQFQIGLLKKLEQLEEMLNKREEA